MDEDEIVQRPGCLRRVARLLGYLTLGCAGLGTLGLVATTCVPMAARYGIWTDTCPVGTRLSLEVENSGLARGMARELVLRPRAVWRIDTDGANTYTPSSAMYRGGWGTVRLLDSHGAVVADDVVESWRWRYSEHRATVRLPAVPDGDYVLQVSYGAGFDDTELELPLPLYASALVHVMPDRPLVRPGDEVQFRSVTLAATDRAPMPSRPGRWRLTDPTGEVVWEEKDRTSEWGVASTRFPLDASAPRGRWTITWESGTATASAPIDVRPFELPRLEATVTPSAPWLAPGERLKVRGTVSYASGAALPDTPVQVRLQTTEGAWPLPLAWTELPPVRTDASGRFELDLGPVPGDLRSRSVLSIQASATDPTGEEVGAAGRVVLSADPLHVAVETELGQGLVGGFNNRAWVRVTRPDGAAVADTEISVKPAWETDAEGWTARTDADGVAVVQLDPGDPVTVVLPEIPVRHRPFVPTLPSLERASGVAPTGSRVLAERRALERLQSSLHACSPLVRVSTTVSHTLRVSADGTIRRVVDTGTSSPASRCVADRMRGARLNPGPVRTLAVQWRLEDPRSASLRTVVVPGGGALGQAMDDAALEARSCVETVGGRSRQLLGAHLALTQGSTTLEVDGIDARGEVGACLSRALRKARLGSPAEADAIAAVVWTYEPGHADTTPKAQVRTQEGYELAVSLASDATVSGRVVVSPGVVPPLRVRLDPPMPSPGDRVRATFVRGAGFHGILEGDVALTQGTKEWDEATFEEGSRALEFTVPDDARGFAEVRFAGARAVLFVPDSEPFALSMSTPDAVVRPGSTLTVGLETTSGGRGVPAAVGLVGVDSTLGQLTSLPGPDALGTAMVRVESPAPAFGTFSSTQLALGQIRGANAATASLMRVGALPNDGGGEPLQFVRGRATLDTTSEQADAFHRVLTELYREVGDWEAHAPKGEVMTPARMVELYDRALGAIAERGGRVTDGFGVEVHLHTLPDELVVLADPREVVQDSTRLDEDVVSWTRFVREEVP